MKTAHNPLFKTNYAAVTFSNTATVNFKFLPYTTAASELTKITYPNGGTNTQAGLAEAKKLFIDPSSGTLPIIFHILLFQVCKKVFVLISFTRWSIKIEDKTKNAFILVFGSENKFCDY